MRVLLIGPAIGAAFGTTVLAQSPNMPPQIQTSPRGQLSGPGMQPAMPLPQKPLLPSIAPRGGVPQNNPTLPSSILGTATVKSMPPMKLDGAAIPPGSGSPVGDAATRIEAKPAVKAKAGGLQAKPLSFPKKDRMKATSPPAEATIQPTMIGPGRPPDKSGSSGAPGSSSGGTPKGDSEQSAADRLKNLVPAMKGPKLPVGASNSDDRKGTSSGQSQTRSSKSADEQSEPLGTGLGPKLKTPPTGKAAPPIVPGKSGTTISVRPAQARSGGKHAAPGLNSDQSGLAVEKIGIATEEVERK